MKNLMILLLMFTFLVAACCPNVNAQTSSYKEVGNAETYMTPDQITKYHSDIKIAELEKKADIKIAELERKFETYGNWVGVGGEIGTAIEEGLSAVVGVADKFGKTDVGKFTLVMVAWKVIGKDIIRIVLGFIFLIIFTWLLIYSFKKTCVETKVLIKNENPGFFKYPKIKEWKIIEPLFTGGEGLGAIRIIHILFFFVAIWITFAVMFGG